MSFLRGFDMKPVYTAIIIACKKSRPNKVVCIKMKYLKEFKHPVRIGFQVQNDFLFRYLVSSNAKEG